MAVASPGPHRDRAGVWPVSSLTEVQKVYLWLAGSYPERVLVQGRGYRGRPIKYGLSGEDELVLFGYSDPAMWLSHRGLLRRLQAHNTYTLTEEGERAFAAMVLRGDGDDLKGVIQQVGVKP